MNVPGRLFHRLVLAGFCLGVVACAQTTTKIEADASRVDRYRAEGYPGATIDDLHVSQLTGASTDTNWYFSLTWAGHPNASAIPVVFFFPELGDAPNGHNRWVETWAKAGYLVISLQADSLDTNIWESDLAKSGDFARIAKGRFSESVTKRRLLALKDSLDWVRAADWRAIGPGVPPDWQHVALAGDGLGAFTVQRLLAADAATRHTILDGMTVRGAVMISPRGRSSTNPVDSPPRTDCPILMVSSRKDIDPYGIDPDAQAKRRAFADLGSPRGYYLELGDASHRWLGGAKANGGDAQTVRPAFFQDEVVARQMSRSHTSQTAPASPEDEEVASLASIGVIEGSRDQRDARWAQLRGAQLTRITMAAVSLESVSRAFLDANVLEKNPAQLWLDGKAADWLQPGDELSTAAHRAEAD